MNKETIGLKPCSKLIRFKYLLFGIVLAAGGFYYLHFDYGTEILIFNNEKLIPSQKHRAAFEGHQNSFTIRTSGCTIPGLEPLHDSIKNMVKFPENTTPCPNAGIPLLSHNNTHIWINNNNRKYYSISEYGNITCCYRSFYRPNSIEDINAPDIDNRVQYELCIDFTDQIMVSDEFVRVTCSNDNSIVYEQFFLYAPKKSLSTRKINDKMYNIVNDIEEKANQSGYNVIVIGLDAISRLNFHRTMPRSLAYLKDKGAIELLGYNKVGDNTFPNLIPMLLGITEAELNKTCWPHMTDNFDNCPFIWEWFKDAGYYTAFGEDSSSLGTFNFERFGFSRTPTHYYIHTFMHEAEINVGTVKDFNSQICMGDKHFYKVLLDYIKSLTITLKSSKLFGFFWEVTMSHDYLNYPFLMDTYFENFLKSLDVTNYLDNTILILLSDHGMRWGEIRLTKQGRLEERLPLFQILLPQSFRENFTAAYDNLKFNRRRLTTPFDVHETLVDLLNLDKIKNEKIASRISRSYADARGISLFLPVPDNRTCAAAGIDDHWCTCNKEKKMLTSQMESLEASKQLVKFLNALLSDHRQCATLELETVQAATEMVSGTPRKGEYGWREFLVMVRTQPGGGVFEGTLRNDGRNWSLAGTVSRLNLYGQQSRCVHEYLLKLYCYCR